MALDPKQDELESMVSMASIFKWACLELSKTESAGEMEGALCKVLGLRPNTVPRILGMSSEADYDAAFAAWKAPDGTAARPPTIIELGVAKLRGAEVSAKKLMNRQARLRRPTQRISSG